MRGPFSGRPRRYRHRARRRIKPAESQRDPWHRHRLRWPGSQHSIDLEVPFTEIRTLATDSSSRTSVALSRILLAKKYGVTPKLYSQRPHLAAMLEQCDAALIIGDAALVLDPADLPFHVLDLGAEWTAMTGLPMVFAVWAARAGVPTQDPAPFLASLRFGMAHIDDIVRQEHAKLGISEALAREYLTRNIVFELGEREYKGLSTFLQYASELETPVEMKRVTV